MSNGSIVAAVDALELWCKDSNIAWEEQARQRFERFIEALLYHQQKTNLTGFDTAEKIVSEMIIDSLQLLRIRELSGPLLDIGTGAGFPSIPLKILRPEIEMVLVEPRSKRYAFLRLMQRELGLSSLTIYGTKLASIPPQAPKMVVSKAFLPLGDWLNLTRNWLLAGACVVCYCSHTDWLDAYERISDPNGDFRLDGVIVENGRVYASLVLRAA